MSHSIPNPHGLVGGAEAFMGSNLPVQMFRADDGKAVSVTFYMPRKEACFTEEMPMAEARQAARNSAILLRNFAALMDAFADGKVGHVYYPDEVVADAIEEYAKEIESHAS